MILNFVCFMEILSLLINMRRMTLASIICKYLHDSVIAQHAISFDETFSSIKRPVVRMCVSCYCDIATDKTLSIL